MNGRFTTAVVPAPPVILERQASIARAVGRIAEAGAAGARLVVFPEAYIGGYPVCAWRLRAEDDGALLGKLHERFLAEAADVDAGDLDPIRDAAREGAVVVVIGVNEIERQSGGTTVQNSVVTIDADGALLNVHRKLVPTDAERSVWGPGDALGLRVVETAVGRVATLICWEAYMPLARFALYAQGVEVLVVPTWDCSDQWTASMRHVAREGACWVVSTATSLRAADLPPELPEPDSWARPDGWLCEGRATVVRPSGRIAAGPLQREEPLLVAEIDLGHVRRTSDARRRRPLRPPRRLLPLGGPQAAASRGVRGRMSPVRRGCDRPCGQAGGSCIGSSQSTVVPE